MQIAKRMRHTWSGGNEFAWDSRGSGFAYPQGFFFQTANIPFQKIVGLLLSAFVFAAYLPHLRIVLLHAVYCCCFLCFHVLVSL